MIKNLTRRLKKPLKKKAKSRRLISWRIIILLCITLLFTAAFIAAKTLFADLPSPKKLTTQTIPVSTQIFDRHGTLLYEIYADIHRNPLPLDQIPDQVKQATIAIEDQNFYTHFGFSVQGIARAIKNTIFKDKLQGGSTITQQLVKTSLLTPERTLKRKIREAVLTIGTEILYTKNEILEMYLNNIPYGGTAYGIEAASNRYFNKSAAELSLPEAALLAGLPQAPSRYSPFSNPDNAKARQQEVLRRMSEDGFIEPDTATQAFETPLIYNTPSTDIKAPHFVFYVKQLLEEKYGLTTVEQGGLRVTTTLDLSLQEYAQASISAEIAGLEKYQVSNGAALITNPGTGEILAMVGSRDYFDTQNDGQVNVTLRLRQPGSSIKPLNYVTALQTKRLTASSVILDYPTCFKVGVLTPYCPKNYTGGFHGSVSFRQALANSYNIPAVKVLAINGLESMIATASAMGISTFTQPERYGLSLTLGGGEVTMLDMGTAFGTLANTGVKVPLTAILNVTDYQGNVLEEYNPQTTLESLALFLDPDNPDSNILNYTNHQLTRVLNREPAFIINHILADNNARAAAFGINSKLRIPDKTVSAKTGTTNDLRDNWTVGYTPDRVVVVWVGNNDNTPMNRNVVSGVTGAAPIFNSLMTHTLVDFPDTPLEPPPGIKAITVCNQTGTYALEGVECSSRSEFFWDQALPGKSPIERRGIWVFKDTGYPAFPPGSKPDTEPVDNDSIELREHTLFTDGLIQDFCLDCPYPTTEDGRVQYPQSTVTVLPYDIAPSSP